jgi:hypothetical protein
MFLSSKNGARIELICYFFSGVHRRSKTVSSRMLAMFSTVLCGPSLASLSRTSPSKGSSKIGKF